PVPTFKVELCRKTTSFVPKSSVLPFTTGHCLLLTKQVLPCIEVQRPFALLTGAHAAPAERANRSAANAATGRSRTITARRSNPHAGARWAVTRPGAVMDGD